MAEIKKYSRMTEDLLVYGGDTTKTPTSMQMMMDFMIQEADSVGDLVDAILWQPSKTYSVKEVVHSSNMPKGYVAECKQAGQSGNNEPQWNASTKSYSDGTVKWELKNAIGGDGVAIGMIIPFAGNGDIPAGYLICNGASVNKVTYPDLFNSIGYTYGGSGDYFNLPNLTDKFIEGSGTAGTNKEAGLPNISGGFNAYSYKEGSGRGAFYSNTSNPSQAGGSSSDKNYDEFNFDASRSNSIYGRSNTVQPPALTMRYIIKAFAGASAESTDLAITNVANELNVLKAEFDNNNFVSENSSQREQRGYVKLSNGFIIQWGYEDLNKHENRLVTFPTPFSSMNYQVTCSGRTKATNTSSGLTSHYCQSNSNTNFYLCHDYTSNESPYGANWIACGF